MSERKSIRITCQGKGTIGLEAVVGIQGNLKKISRVNLEKLKGRILKRGFNVPYHIWQHGGKSWLLDGHQRTKALLELQAQGYHIPPLPYDEIQANSLADAKDALLGIASQYGEFTMGGLREFTVGMEIDADLRLPAGEIRLESIRPPEDQGVDDVPEKAPRITKAGELWSIGPHRLVVGDATSPGAYELLMGEELAQLAFTDPPYGVEYDSRGELLYLGGITNDKKKGEDLEKRILAPAFRLMGKHTLGDAAFYIFHASATRIHFERAMQAAGLLERQYIVWVKPWIVMGRGAYHYQHEPCFYASKGDKAPRWTGDRTQSSIWTASFNLKGQAHISLAEPILLHASESSHIYIAAEPPKKKYRTVHVEPGETAVISPLDGGDVWQVSPDRKKDYEHPNQKPVELAARAITNHTEAGEIVLDPFAGSGSTLIAAERTGRRARVIELDRHFADIIIKRWCLYIHAQHLEPEVLRNGKPYEWTKFCPEL
jgi:DNA modification methylase